MILDKTNSPSFNKAQNAATTRKTEVIAHTAEPKSLNSKCKNRIATAF